MRLLLYFCLSLCLFGMATFAYSYEVRQIPPQVPPTVSDGAPNINEVWLNHGGARVYWNTLTQPNGIRLIGSRFNDPASVPQLIKEKPAKKQNKKKKKKQNQPVAQQNTQITPVKVPENASSTALQIPDKPKDSNANNSSVNQVQNKPENQNTTQEQKKESEKNSSQVPEKKEDKQNPSVKDNKPENQSVNNTNPNSKQDNNSQNTPTTQGSGKAPLYTPPNTPQEISPNSPGVPPRPSGEQTQVPIPTLPQNK